MDVSRGRTGDASRLDRLSAHANLAEAERHGALAAVAWSTRSKESVSDELVMAADHVERATLDWSVCLVDVLESPRAHSVHDAEPYDPPVTRSHVCAQAVKRSPRKQADPPYGRGALLVTFRMCTAW